MIRLVLGNNFADYVVCIVASAQAWGACLIKRCSEKTKHEVEVNMPTNMALKNNSYRHNLTLKNDGQFKAKHENNHKQRPHESYKIVYCASRV